MPHLSSKYVKFSVFIFLSLYLINQDSHKKCKRFILLSISTLMSLRKMKRISLRVTDASRSKLVHFFYSYYHHSISSEVKRGEKLIGDLCIVSGATGGEGLR